MNYRARKFNISTHPTDQPALYTYALNDTAQTTYYVSWNGATEVVSWTFYSGSSADSLAQVGNARKNGFETVARQPRFHAFTVAEAVAWDGTRLRNSSLTRTFVPGAALASSCDPLQCPMVDGSASRPQVLELSAAPTGGWRLLRLRRVWLMRCRVSRRLAGAVAGVLGGCFRRGGRWRGRWLGWGCLYSWGDGLARSRMRGIDGGEQTAFFDAVWISRALSLSCFWLLHIRLGDGMKNGTFLGKWNLELVQH